MAGIPDKIQTWQMVQPTTFDRETKKATPGKIEKTELPVPELKPGGCRRRRMGRQRGCDSRCDAMP